MLLPIGLFAVVAGFVFPALLPPALGLVAFWLVASVLNLLTASHDGPSIVVAGLIVVALLALVI